MEGLVLISQMEKLSLRWGVQTPQPMVSFNVQPGEDLIPCGPAAPLLPVPLKFELEVFKNMGKKADSRIPRDPPWPFLQVQLT